MRSYTPPPTPKERAEMRAYRIRILLWAAIVPPLIFALMLYGYSDQAPAFLREIAIALDGPFGSPVWNFLNPAGAK